MFISTHSKSHCLTSDQCKSITAHANGIDTGTFVSRCTDSPSDHTRRHLTSQYISKKSGRHRRHRIHYGYKVCTSDPHPHADVLQPLTASQKKGLSQLKQFKTAVFTPFNPKLRYPCHHSDGHHAPCGPAPTFVDADAMPSLIPRTKPVHAPSCKAKSKQNLRKQKGKALSANSNCLCLFRHVCDGCHDCHQ